MSTQETFYITTPIYYPNDKLHVGHCYTTTVSDVFARYKRLRGFDVMFLTGMDEHGQKIQREADASGQHPQAFVDHMATEVKELWEVMNISYDRFIRTTDEEHVRRVQEIFRRMQANGDIYKGRYKGWYCTPCEAFWTETQAGAEHLCPDCGRPVIMTEEESYFFRLSKYEERLKAHYREHPAFAEPASRRNEMIRNFLEPGLDDLAISRSTFDWGIPVPGDPDHVIYVWIDALSNYITALGYPDLPEDFERYWPADVHLMAKEIFRFHSIIWPAMLMSLDLPLPKKIYGHGWLLFGGDRMSKSKGNVVDPKILCERYGVDAVRFFLLREIVFGTDGHFSAEALLERINIDLANDLGNLLSRTTAMCAKYFDGVLPNAREAGGHDGELETELSGMGGRYHEHFDAMSFHLVLDDVWKLVRRSNKYIDETEPWILGREEGSQARLASVLEHLLEVLRHIALALCPFMPETAGKMLTELAIPCDEEAIRTAFQRLGAYCPEKPLRPIRPAKPLFPRLDLEKELMELESIRLVQTGEGADPASAGDESTEAATGVEEDERHKVCISYEDFAKLELRVAKVLACDKVPKTDKLLRFDLDIGGGEIRQVLSGIAEFYRPEDLVEREVVYLANLSGRKIRGLMSEGMILSAEDADGAIVLLKPESTAGAGAEIL